MIFSVWETDGRFSSLDVFFVLLDVISVFWALHKDRQGFPDIKLNQD